MPRYILGMIFCSHTGLVAQGVSFMLTVFIKFQLYLASLPSILHVFSLIVIWGLCKICGAVIDFLLTAHLFLIFSFYILN